MRSIYLDNNATTALDEKVAEVMKGLLGEPLNPSSVHGQGRKARAIINDVRKKLLEFLNAEDYRVIFTSSGTEANNIAIFGLEGYEVLVSAIEHSSVMKPAVKKNAVVVAVDKNGIIKLDVLEELLKARQGKKILVSVMLANNETGVIQPIKDVMVLAHKYGAIVHTDAAQCIGKIKVDVADLGVDMLTISAHKFSGPQGAAALIAKKSVPLVTQILGGGQEQNYRAGTENVVAIAGLGAALDVVDREVSSAHEIEKLRNYLEREIRSFLPETEFLGGEEQRLPNTSCVVMPDVSNETQLIHFDLAGIAVSAGAACSSGKMEESHVLKAMGINGGKAKTAIRVSLGKNNTSEDVSRFVQEWKSLYVKLNKKAA